MPFAAFHEKKTIEDERMIDLEFVQAWDESRTEYKLLAELVKLRKEKHLTQSELAFMTGNKQQVISRIEKRKNSPTLRTFCGLLNTLGYDLQIIKKENDLEAE